MTCPHCPADSLVFVKRLDFDLPHKDGNPFRMVCAECGSHIRMVSRAVWQDSEHQYVQDGPGTEPVPQTDYNDNDDDEVAGKPENRFDCPACGAEQAGYPDDCGACGQEYFWEE